MILTGQRHDSIPPIKTEIRSKKATGFFIIHAAKRFSPAMQRKKRVQNSTVPLPTRKPTTRPISGIKIMKPITRRCILKKLGTGQPIGFQGVMRELPSIFPKQKTPNR